MGLLDQIGGVLGGQAGKAEQLQAIMTRIEQQGGIQGITEKFRSGGLGEIVESWLSQQSNMSVNSDPDYLGVRLACAAGSRRQTGR